MKGKIGGETNKVMHPPKWWKARERKKIAEAKKRIQRLHDNAAINKGNQ